MSSEDPIAQMISYNNRLIEQFRANGGKVTGRFADAPLLLLTTTGAKSGVKRTTPLAHSTDGDDIIIIASYAGNPKHPNWYLNIRANAEVTIELPNETFTTNAIIPEGEDRKRLFDQQAEKMPAFAEYQAKTTREIPVIVIPRP